jgi:hypothetical protein
MVPINGDKESVVDGESKVEADYTLGIVCKMDKGCMGTNGFKLTRIFALSTKMLDTRQPIF